jgi:hypothetical protein
MKRTAAILLLLSIGWFTSPPTGYGAAANPPEEIWKSLEKLPPAEREKKLIEGARSEGEMIWYTNSGLENATRYIEAFKKIYPSSTHRFGAPRHAKSSRGSLLKPMPVATL